jgi:hypothetical protein
MMEGIHVPIRAHKGRLRAILAIVTMATLLATPFQAFGAKGSTLEAEPISALGPTVSAGQLAAFKTSFENTGSSTITHFQFTGTVTNGALYWPTPFCSDVEGRITCDFGSLAANATASLTIVFVADGGGDVGLSGQFAGDARKGGPGAKQDTWNAGSDTVTLGPSGDFYASWQLEEAAEFGVVSDQQTSVSLIGPGSGYFTLLRQMSADLICESGNVTGTITGYGKLVQLEVADGDDADIEMTIIFASAPGLSANTLKIVHEDDGNCFELPRCSGDTNYCFVASNEGTGNARRVQATIYLPYNGRLKGF